MAKMRGNEKCLFPQEISYIHSDGNTSIQQTFSESLLCARSCSGCQGRFKRELLLVSKDHHVHGTCYNRVWAEPDYTSSGKVTFGLGPEGWVGVSKWRMRRAFLAARPMLKRGTKYMAHLGNGRTCSVGGAQGEVDNEHSNTFWLLPKRSQS